MKKILLSLGLLSSFVFADVAGDKIIHFLKGSIKKEMKIEKISINKKIKLDDRTKWKAYIVDIKFKGKKKFSDIFFSNGIYVTQGLIRLDDSKDMRNFVSEKSVSDLPKSFYSKSNLVYGKTDAKNQMVIISDPLCPFCIPYVADVLSYAQKNKLDLAVYYVAYPLERIHPTSLYLSALLKALKNSGVKNVYSKYYSYVKKNKPKKELYSSKAKVKELVNKIFNKPFDENQIVKNIATIQKESKIVLSHGIGGTPAVIFNHALDPQRSKIYTLGKKDEF